MASPTQWTWVWVNSGSWWWTRKPGLLHSVGWQRVEHNKVTELNWNSKILVTVISHYYNRQSLIREGQQDKFQFSSVQSLSRVWLFVTLWTVAHQVSLSITDSCSLLKLMSIESVIPSNHFILCHPLLFLPSAFHSIRVFSNGSVLHIRWSKYWSFSFSISPSNEHSGLISFKMDWLDLSVVQGTLKSLLQHHSSKASILWCSAFFMVQLSHSYMTTGKTIALTTWTLLAK